MRDTTQPDNHWPDTYWTDVRRFLFGFGAGVAMILLYGTFSVTG